MIAVVAAAIMCVPAATASAGETPPPAPNVVINEVNCEGTDWIELANTGDAPADISGWLLTDDALDRDPLRADHRMLFGAGTSIAAGALYVVERGATGFPFGVSCEDDTIRLADAAGALAGQVVMPGADLSSAANTWGRYPNGTGGFAETVGTKGTTNLPATGEDDPDLAGWLFDPTRVVAISLGLPQASREALALDPTAYQNGSFSLTVDGTTYGPLAVGIRLKGGIGSFRTLAGKAAFKLKFDHVVAGQRFFGLRRLTLNNMVQDPTGQHERLTYDLFRAAGVPAPRTGYSQIKLDGVDYGLYLTLETIDIVALRRWFDTTQHLYEGAYDVDVYAPHVPYYEVDEGSESDRADVEALAAATADGPEPFSQRVAAVADLDQMTLMWAVERYTGHWDGYSSILPGPNNYYLHSDSAGVFTMLPWGTDQALLKRLHFVGPGGVLFSNCLAEPACRQLYFAHLLALPAIAAPLDLAGRLEQAAALLAPYQQADPRTEHTAAQVASNLKALRRFLAVRDADLADPDYWLPDTPPETEIVAGPRRFVRAGRGPERSVAFRFRSSEPDSRFDCRVDAGEWYRCHRAERFRAGLGKHVIWVRAIDPALYVDQTPARRQFNVVAAAGR